MKDVSSFSFWPSHMRDGLIAFQAFQNDLYFVSPVFFSRRRAMNKWLTLFGAILAVLMMFVGYTGIEHPAPESSKIRTQY